MNVMQIPRRVDYGLRAAIYLSTTDPSRSCSIAEIAKEQAVPKKFLEKILRDLARSGLVKSKRGQSGGYSLAKSPGEISFQDIIEALEGPVAVNACMDETQKCDHLPRCLMIGVWNEVQQKVMEILTRTTLADFRQSPCQARANSISLSSAA